MLTASANSTAQNSGGFPALQEHAIRANGENRVALQPASKE